MANYSDRVHPDVRSIGEELMHVASTNFRIAMTGHLHKHLGKLISNSRSVGVVPPWSG